MTTHELAKQLLGGPDIGVVVPKVIEYDDDPDDSCADPVVSITDAYENGVQVKVAIISYSSSDHAQRPGPTPAVTNQPVELCGNITPPAAPAEAKT